MIKELSEIRRLHRVGKIHLGIKLKNQKGTEFPKAVDYFVVKEDESTPAHAAEAFKKEYGDKPKQLDIMFPVDAVNICWDYFYKSYVRTAKTGSKLICKGDGETAMRLNMQTGELDEIPCLSPESCEFALDDKGQPTKCRRVGQLQFLLPKVGILGVWQIDTGSFNGVVALNSDIDMIRSVTGGRLAMIPLTLRLVPKKANVEGKQSIIHHLTIEWGGTIKNLVDFTKNQRRQISYQADPPPADEIPQDLVPNAPQIGHDAPAPTAKLAEQHQEAPAQPQDEPEGGEWNDEPQEAAAEPVEPARPAPAPAKSQPAAEDTEKRLQLSQQEMFIMAQKGLDPDAGRALKATFKTTAEFFKHLGTLPDVNTKKAAPTKLAAGEDLDAQIQAEFARLKWAQPKIESMLRFYKDKTKLLTILKGAK